MAQDVLRVPLSITVVLGFTIGLIVTLLFGDTLGLPWSFYPAFVVFVLIGIYLLQHPKAYLVALFLYFGFFATFRASGGGRVIPLYLPLERLYDEFFLAVPLAIIVMKASTRIAPPPGTRFFVLFPLLAYASWYVNRPPALGALRITVAYMKVFILWYFTRCIGPWSRREQRFLVYLLVAFAFVQVLVNMVLWQKSPFLRIHPDNSTGTLGSAHFVGYVSAMALFVVAGIFAVGNLRWSWKLIGVLGVTVLIAYNLIFLTDTKHALIMVPFCAIPFFTSPRIPAHRKILLLGGLFVFMLGTYLYFKWHVRAGAISNWAYLLREMGYSGKKNTLRVIFTVFPKELPFFPLGAGPGNFCSSVAFFSLRPLAVKYILPYTQFAYGLSQEMGTSIGAPMNGIYTVLGEFGIVNAFVYFGVWVMILKHLRQSMNTETDLFRAGALLGLFCSVIFYLLANVVIELFSTQFFQLCLGVLLGAYWERPLDSVALDVGHLAEHSKPRKGLPDHWDKRLPPRYNRRIAV